MLHVLQAENRTPGFHVQPDSDEMFCVMEGRFRIELEDSLADHSEGDFPSSPGAPAAGRCARALSSAFASSGPAP